MLHREPLCRPSRKPPHCGFRSRCTWAAFPAILAPSAHPHSAPDHAERLAMMRRAARALLGAAPTLARSSGGAASAAAEAAGTPPWWCRRAARRSMWTDPR